MNFINRIEHIIRTKAFVVPAISVIIAIFSTAVVLADEITIFTAHADTELTVISEEEKKKEFIDPKEIVFDDTTEITDIVTTEEIEEVEEETEVIEEEYPLVDQIADYAYRFVGWLPYVWGGESLEYGADCCGFTMAIYRAFGIEIPRTVEAQAYTGYSVSLEDALPGDIVIYYGHVGLYAGDGMVIHLPYPGAYATYADVHIQEILDIRRIVDPS